MTKDDCHLDNFKFHLFSNIRSKFRKEVPLACHYEEISARGWQLGHRLSRYFSYPPRKSQYSSLVAMGQEICNKLVLLILILVWCILLRLLTIRKMKHLCSQLYLLYYPHFTTRCFLLRTSPELTI
jgi:hypothetical protein